MRSLVPLISLTRPINMRFTIPIQLTKKQTILTVLVSVLLLIAIIITTALLSNTQQPEKQNGASAPSFAAVLPNGKTISDLGGWQRLDPPNNDPIYIFTDTINSVPISVSQQTLPSTFKSNLSQSVADLAKNYSATTELNAGGIKVYIGTSAKGPQSVIFTMNDLLILIKSQGRIDNDAWVNYISKLSS